MPKIFISYSSKARPLIDQLADDLELLVYDAQIWFDRELNRSGGHQWWSLILKSIRECDLFVYAITPHILSSVPCQREYAYARALGKPVLPIVLTAVEIRYLPLELQDAQLIRYDQRTRDQQRSVQASIRNLPPAPPLPNPLPPEPEVPRDPVAVLLDKIARLTADVDQQRLLILEIDDLQEDPAYLKFIPELLTRLVAREDVLTVRNLKRANELLTQHTKVSVEIHGQPAAPPVPPVSTPLPTGIPALAASIRAILGDPFDLCEVPAGEFQCGDKGESGNQPRKLTLPAFAIAKYPMTYRQFQVFVDADDGFGDARWWDGLAADADHRRAPGDQAWKTADHPRERVSWYDAMAFCRWLSHRLGGETDLKRVDDWRVRLPTEWEWEKAARGTDGRIYPYDKTFDQAKGHTNESGLGKTTPVTQYPNGASPYGVFDMSGNVWEWMLTEYQKPTDRASEADLTSSAARGWRGGSWYDSQYYARAVYRGSLNPDLRNNAIGFRIMVPLQNH